MNISSLSPMSEVHLCKGVPLDNTYRDTLTFNNTGEQYQYFAGKVKTGCDFTNLRPVDITNAIKLPINAYTIYDCNYLMFKNDNFSDKWLYAFITSIDFINVNACQINFEIDVMQTWYFDYNLNYSFVVREHVNDDSLGKNLVEEGLETGEYKANASVQNFDFSEQYVCILTSLKFSDMTTASGTIINNVYSGLDALVGTPVGDLTTLNYELGKYIDAGKEDAIAGVFQYPAFCNNATATAPATDTRAIGSALDTIDGYTPKNKKLFTYPYNFLIMSNNEGKAIPYRYENFSNPQEIEFGVAGVFFTTPTVFVYPKNHRGIIEDYDSGLTISNFPQCAWVGDAFKAWFSQNKGSLAVSTLSTVVNSGINTAGGNKMALVQGGEQIGANLGSIYDHTQIPPTIHGQINCDSLNSAMNRYKFSIYSMSIKSQFAKIIDDYFTKFGYKVNAVKVPNRTGRPYWNYVQTIDCNCTGAIPFGDISKIREIYDKGITFWHGDYVGNYSLDNSI